MKNLIFICLLATQTFVFGAETGTANQVLRYPSSAPAGTRPKYGAVNIASSSAVTGTLGATNGGTGQSTVTTGDVLYGSGTNAWSKLAAGGQGTFFRMGSTTPAWGFPNVVSKTTTYTATAADDVILASSSAFTITLPTAVGVTGKVYYVKKTDSSLTNIVTIGTTSAQTIDGSSTTTLNTQYEAVTLVSDGSNWQVLDRIVPSIITTYTPTISWSNTTAYGTWSREKNKIRVTVLLAMTGGTSGNSTFNLPSGISMSTASFPNSAPASSYSTMGYCGAVHASTGVGYLYPLYSTTTQFIIAYANSSNAALTVSGTAPTTWANGDSIWCEVIVPIAAWN